MQTHLHKTFGTPRWQLGVILLVALLLRLAYVLAQDFDAYYTKGGGDTVWYLENGYTLVTGENPTGKHDVSRLSTAPLYLVYVGIWQALLAPQAAIVAILISQALGGVAIVYFAYAIAHSLTRDTRVGLLAAGSLAISPQLILESARVLTESLFMVLLMGGLCVYIRGTRRNGSNSPIILSCIVAGSLFGLATLTRAVFLLFPLGLVLHLFLIHRAQAWRLVLALLVSYAAVISSWTVYNWLAWERLVIGGEGIRGFIYQGATGKASPEELDEGLNLTPENADEQRHEAMQEVIEETIGEDPIGWAAHRVRELADAYLQPHNTNTLQGKSFRAAASHWLRHDRSPAGLRDLTRIQSFWPKLAIYVFHFGGLILGAAGMWISRRRWRDLLPLYGLIAYFTGIYLVLLALPRYIFPTYPIFWLFAAVFILAVWDRRTGQRPA